MTTGPLQGIRVLDFTRFLAGPYATMLMADLGASVIKIEEPGGDHTRTSGPYLDSETKDHDIGGFFNSLNRSKYGICIDLKSEGGRDLILKLVKDVDVVVENFRGGVMERYGLNYEVLSKVNPRLVYSSIRGFGDKRTLGTNYPERPTVDLLVQAVSGIMSITGSADGDMYKIGPGIGDIFPGTMSLVGILSALQWRERTGEGQYVDTSMYDSMLSLCERMLYQYSYTKEVPKPMGNAHPFRLLIRCIRRPMGILSWPPPMTSSGGVLPRPSVNLNSAQTRVLPRVPHGASIAVKSTTSCAVGRACAPEMRSWPRCSRTMCWPPRSIMHPTFLPTPKWVCAVCWSISRRIQGRWIRCRLPELR